MDRYAAYILHQLALQVLLVFIRYPIVNGGSVLAIKYKDGVMMATDTLGTHFLHTFLADPLTLVCAGSYGNTAMFPNLCRMRQVGDHSVVGAGGDYSDFQTVTDNLVALT